MSIKSLKRHEGWLFIDHRASPGLPEHVARLAGYDPKLCREGALFETATLTCCHCGNAYAKNPFRVRAREYCKPCDHYICDGCYGLSQHADYVHIPFKARVLEPNVDYSAPRIIVP
jgi:hypothetical protein